MYSGITTGLFPVVKMRFLRKPAVDSSRTYTRSSEPECTLVPEDSSIASTKQIESIVEFQNKPLEKCVDILEYTVRFSKELAVNLRVGDSVSVDGVCQTVINIDEDNISFQAIPETLSKTTLHKLTLHSLVSIERSLKLGDEIGGHEVAGHVFGTGVISQILQTDESLTLVIHCNPSWMKYILTKGYIAVDGSSLTVGDTDNQKGLFVLHLIPETIRRTNFGNKKVGDLVNIEFDYKTKTIVDTVERIMAENK